MTPRFRKIAAGVAVGTTLAALAAGCGSDDKKSSSAPTKEKTTAQAPAAGGAKGATVALAADPSGKIAFDKKTLNAKAGTTKIAFTNASQVSHAVEVEGNGVEEKTRTFAGDKADLSLKLKPGTYEFYCPVSDHEEEGMKGELVVK